MFFLILIFIFFRMYRKCNYEGFDIRVLNEEEWKILFVLVFYLWCVFIFLVEIDWKDIN